MLLHVLAHVELDQRVLVIEEELRQRLGQLGLPNAGRPQEDEGATRPLRILEAGTGPSDRLRQRGDRLFLADDPLVQLVLHAKQLGGLLLREPIDRDAGPVGQHLGDDLLVDHVEELDALCTELRVLGLLELQALALLLGQLLGLLKSALLDGGFLVLAQPVDLLIEGLVRARHVHPTDAEAASRLVDEVDSLIGQESIRHVAVGEVRRRHQRLVSDRHRVVRFIPIAKTLQNIDGHRHARLIDVDWLEASLEGGVLLDVLAILVDRGGTHRLELATGQHRLQDRGGVDGTLCGTGTHERVDLVDEQDDVATGADLLEHLLQALLEVTPVAGTRHQRAEVKRVELLVGQCLGHVASHDLLRQALNDGGLADAGLSDEDRVVLGPPREHLHDALDLLVTPHQWVELVVPGELRQVPTELVEDGGSRAGLRRACTRSGPHGLLALVARHHLDHLLAHSAKVRSERDQHLCGHTLTLADEAEEHVLGADVGVTKLQRLAQ